MDRPVSSIRLSDQLVVGPVWPEREDILHRTTVSAKVGYGGTDRHAVWATVWAPREAGARPSTVSAGIPSCGSRRGTSSTHSYSLTLPVTCGRCLASPYSLRVESLPEDVITVDPSGRLIPKEA